MPSNNKTTGKAGEDAACSHLRRLGYRIIARNYKTHIGEIDVVAIKRNTLAFVEVKCRRIERFGRPFESVTTAKQRKIRQVAQQFLSTNRLPRGPAADIRCRFDVISIIAKESADSFDITHLKGAF